MNSELNNTFRLRNVLPYVALATGLILLIPLLVMQFTNDVNWSGSDFVIMGLLLFSAGIAFVLVLKKVLRKYQIATGILLAIVVMYIWAELAVGIFTNLGS